MTIERDQSLEIIDRALGLAQADDVSVSLHDAASACTRFSDNVLTQNVRNEDRTISVSCAFGQSHGAASTNDLSEDGLRKVVEQAEEAARLSPPDPEHMPPVEADEAEQYAAVDAWDDATAAFDPQGKAADLAAAIQIAQGKRMRLSGALTTRAAARAFGNSRGLRAFHRETYAEIHTTALGDDGTGWHEIHSHRLADVKAAEAAERALEVAAKAQKPSEIAPGRYDLILCPPAVWEMIPGYMICDAKATDEGRTHLRGKLGKQVVGDAVTIRSDPADPRLPASPFQGDGAASQKIDWIKNGVVENLATSRYWAQKSGRPATGRPANIIMEGGGKSLDEMIASTERGILAIRFWYIRVVDPMETLLTGMTRDGLFLIEDGAISRPLINMRFNDSVVGCLNRIEEMGEPVRIGGMLVPPIKVKDFHFSSVTRF